MTSSKTSKSYFGIGKDASDLRALSIRKGGAGWREEISDVDREWAADREPIAHRHTYTFANDMYDNWFQIIAEDEETDLDTAAQKVLTKLNAKKLFIDAETYKRIHGVSLIVGAFKDAASQLDLANPRKVGAELVTAEVYPKTAISQIIKDEDPESERYGLPLYYVLNRGTGKQTKVHYTRVIHYATHPKEMSVLDVMWDDMTIAKNLRWSMGQTLYTRGPGFPVFTLKGNDRTLLAKAKTDIMNNWTAWTGFVKNEDMELEFAGAAGAALNPTPYYEPIFDNLSLATETPAAMLKGANAGALTGSETNAKDYFKGISSEQAKVQPLIIQFLDWLFESGQISATRTESAGDNKQGIINKIARYLKHDKQAVPEYHFKWNPGFEETAKEKASTELIKEQANTAKLQYMKVNEVREKEGLPPVPDGDVVISLNKPAAFDNPFSTQEQQLSSEEEKKEMDEANPAEQHPSLPALLKGFAQAVVKGDLEAEQAFTQGVTVIQRYSELEQQRAETWVRAKTGGRTSVLSPEMKDDLDRQTQQYIRDWRGMVDLAKKLHEKKAQP